MPVCVPPAAALCHRARQGRNLCLRPAVGLERGNPGQRLIRQAPGLGIIETTGLYRANQFP